METTGMVGVTVVRGGLKMKELSKTQAKCVSFGWGLEELVPEMTRPMTQGVKGNPREKEDDRIRFIVRRLPQMVPNDVVADWSGVRSHYTSSIIKIIARGVSAGLEYGYDLGLVTHAANMKESAGLDYGYDLGLVTCAVIWA
ncbi:hypothetical protein ACLOJK_041135 [Asimina triloba]